MWYNVPMKKHLPLLILAAVVILGTLWYFSTSKNPVTQTSENKTTGLPQMHPAQESNRETFITQSHKAIQLAPPQKNEESAPCRESWIELAKMDANQWGKVSGKSLGTTFKFGKESDLLKFKDQFNYSARCQVAKEHPLKQISDEVATLCYPNGQTNSGTVSTLSCMEALMKLRFESIDYLTQNQPIEQMKDTTLLGAKIYAQVMRTGSQRDPEKLMALSRRILELEPDNIAAAEYLAQGSYLKLINSENSDSVKQFEAAAQLLSDSFPNSPLTAEAKMAVARQNKDFGLMRRLASEGAESGLDPNTSSYFMAWASYLENREDEAKTYLNEILQRDPNNDQAKRSLNMLSSSEAIPAELRSKLAPFSDSLATFQYGVTMEPVVLEKPLTNFPE